MADQIQIAKVLTPDTLGKGLTINPITGLLDVSIGDGLQFDNSNALSAKSHEVKKIDPDANGLITINADDGDCFILEYPSWRDYKFSIPKPSKTVVGITLQITEAKKMATIEWPENVYFANGSAPNLSNSDISLITLYTCTGGSMWLCTWFNASK